MKKLLILALLMFMAALLAGCGSDKKKDAAEENKPLTLKLGHTQSQSSPLHLGAGKFAELVYQKTNGEVKVQIFPSSTIGNDKDMAQFLQMGSVDFALLAGVLGDLEPSLKTMEMPYLFKDETHFRKVIYGKVGEELLTRLLASSDIRGLAFWEGGSRQITSNKPINSFNDIKGIKIRVSKTPSTLAAWKALGANPIAMADSLQATAIEAQENSVFYIHSSKVYEVQKYIALTNHNYEYAIMAMSNKSWKKLTPGQQTAISEAAKESSKYENKLVSDKAEELLKDLQKKGMRLTKPDTTGWFKTAHDSHKEFAQEYGIEIYNKIIEAGK